MTKIVFADCEGNDFLDDIDKMWTIQLAEGVDDEVTVYADQPGYPPISKALEIMGAADYVVFHNAFGFDFFAINKIYPGTFKRGQMIDTLVISRLINSTAKRHNLHDLGEAYGYPKLEFSDFSRFSERMAVYGKQDVVILQKMWKGEHRHGKSMPSFGKFYETYKEACELEFETAYWIEVQRQHGFRFDYEQAQILETEFRAEMLTIERELQKVFPPIVTERYSEKQFDKITGKPKRLKDEVEVFNVGSRPQIAKRLIDKYGWKPTEINKKSKVPKIDETILDALPYPEAKMIARYLTLGKKIGQIADGANSWLNSAVINSDGEARVHGQINTLGARTHRMSHFKPNMAQVDGDPRMRSLWLPDKYHYLIGIDAEGLELRELAHFLQPYDQGRYVDIVHSGDKTLGTDIHTMNRNAAGLFLRDSAKTMIYAHNYGCFDKKLGEIVLDDLKAVLDALLADEPTKKQQKIIKEVAGKIDHWEAQDRIDDLGSLYKAGEKLRSKIEVGIVGLGELIAKCKRTHNKKDAMPSHDGRWIPSASDHSALNTLLQGNGSIVMKKSLNLFANELEKAQLLDKVFFCANVHDEFQCSVHPDLVTQTGTDKDGKPIYESPVAEMGKQAITDAGLALGLRCPLVGSADIGLNWSETH